MQNPYLPRVENVLKRMEALSIDALMVSIAENRYYLSGFAAEGGPFDDSAGVLLISPRRRILATDARFKTQAQQQAPLFEVFCYRKGLTAALPDLLADMHTGRLGFESRHLSVKAHQEIIAKLSASGSSVELVPCEDIVERLRAVKDDAEIEATRRAVAIAEAAFAELMTVIQAGMTEKKAAWLLEKAMRENGAEGLAFPPIAAAGPNSALPHAMPSDRPLAAGEPILFDWGARFEGYCSDISRTVVLGAPDPRFIEIHSIVLQAQTRAVTAIRDGRSTVEIDRIARDVIGEAGFGENFGHALGHGTGLVVHERPRLSPLKDSRLAAGMLVTVEPGIYLPDWGGVRLENQVLVCKDDAEVLNHLAITDGRVG